MTGEGGVLDLECQRSVDTKSGQFSVDSDQQAFVVLIRTRIEKRKTEGLSVFILTFTVRTSTTRAVRFLPVLRLEVLDALW